MFLQPEGSSLLLLPILSTPLEITAKSGTLLGVQESLNKPAANAASPGYVKFEAVIESAASAASMKTNSRRPSSSAGHRLSSPTLELGPLAWKPLRGPAVPANLITAERHLIRRKRAHSLPPRPPESESERTAYSHARTFRSANLEIISLASPILNSPKAC